MITRTRTCFFPGSALLICFVLVGCQTSPQQKEAKYLEKGKSLLAKKDYARALLEFRNAARAMPKDAEPWYRMGLDYLANGDARSAVQALQRAVNLNPKHLDARLKLAQLMAGTDNQETLAKAEENLQGILAAEPNNADAIDTLAVIEFKLGKADEAVKRLEANLQRQPAHLQTSVTLAQMKMQSDVPAAEEVLKKAVANSPKSVDAELALGQFYISQKQFVKAEPEIRHALQLDPKSGPALMALGSIQVAENRLGEAEKTYQQVSTLPDPAYKPVHAVFQYAQGRRDAALVEFQKLAAADQSDRAARSRLVSAYTEMGKLGDAEKVLSAALQRNAKDSDALLERSQIYLQQNRLGEAEKDLHEVVRNQPNSAPAHFALSNVFRAQGQPRSERQELNEAIRLDPSLIGARAALARNLIGNNEARNALQVLDQAPAEQKNSLGFVIERNWALLATGQFDEVRTMLAKVPDESRVPEIWLQDAMEKMSRPNKDLAGARQSAEQALQKNPDEVRAAKIIADSYAAQREPAKGLERLKQIAAARPKSPQMQYLLAQWYAATGDAAGSRSALEAAKSADPRFVQASLALADIDRREKKNDAAANRLNEVLKIDPKNTTALLMLAQLKDETGDHNGSLSTYRAVLDNDGGNVFALNNLAYSLAKDKPDEALRYAQHAAEIAPDNPAIQDTLGWVYYRKGIYNAAVGYLKSAVDKEPTPRRQYHLGMCYLKAGNQDLGQKTMQAALKQDPNLPKTERDW